MVVVALPRSQLGSCRLLPALFLRYSTAVEVSEEIEALRGGLSKSGGAARLLVSECSAQLSHRLFPVLVSWTGASHGALAKYGSLYTKHGMHAVCIVPSVFQMWSTTLGNALLSSVFSSINSSLREPARVLLHMFSSAPSVVLPALSQTLSSYANLSLSGVVFECGPVRFSYKSGFAASKAMYDQGGFTLPTYLAANTAGSVVSTVVGKRRRKELSAAMKSDLLAGVPQLFLYSQDDAVAPIEWVESMIKEQQSLGRTVETHCFAGGDHIRNLLTHPTEYQDRLSAFLYKHYLTES